MSKKYYFHEVAQAEIEKLISGKKTIGYLMKNYKQPEWCNYPDALEGKLGCWALMDLSKDGMRTKISRDYCRNCDQFTNPDKL